MAVYWMGDIQGCNAPLGRWLDEVGFSPSRDHLIVLGDLVNRGPDSLGVLRRLMAFQGSVKCVLGNHDLHALAVVMGVRPQHPQDTLKELLTAADQPALIDWIRHQKMAIWSHGVLSVHAGVLPGWTLEKTLSLASEIEDILRSPQLPDFLLQMYGNQPAVWREEWVSMTRWRVVVNALTRLRFCSADGEMEFATKDSAAQAPAGFMPWFDVPGRRTADITVAFGHWSTLGKLNRGDVWALDSGCVWGGCLSAMSKDHDGNLHQIQIRCEQFQVPG
ncbi:MAG: bis(5'-nucleosyl)-tetraphosphatase (symmetrical) [Comamonadaceae bacterium PBBC1]|nr:MAG: bis(5'-nucleosyl)-tetraphosphatase (symmetrical) [Comamonadaceae bacterium PBBC1]